MSHLKLPRDLRAMHTIACSYSASASYLCADPIDEVALEIPDYAFESDLDLADKQSI